MQPTTSAYHFAEHFLGVHEAPGIVASPAILAMLQIVDHDIHDDETPWCSAFVNAVCFLCDLPRTNSLAARSWLGIGSVVSAPADAKRGPDVVILSRGANPAPASVTRAPGHVGFFSRYDPNNGLVYLLGGNQGDKVSIASFPVSRVLGIRRLYNS